MLLTLKSVARANHSSLTTSTITPSNPTPCRTRPTLPATTPKSSFLTRTLSTPARSQIRTPSNAFTPGTKPTSPSTSRSAYSFSWELSRRREEAVLCRRGMVEARIRRAMRIEARGSKPGQLKCRIKRVEMITPTEPRVSARICKKILRLVGVYGLSEGYPCMFEL